MNNEKYKIFLVVINADKEKAPSTESARDFLAVLQDRLLSYNKAQFVATIIHDMDHIDTGEMKTIHLHAVMEYSEKATKRAVLAELAEYLGVDTSLISIDGSNNEFLGVQYLTHKNDQEKAQYSVDLVKTTNRELFERRYNDIYIDPEQRIVDALKSSKTYLELIDKTDVNTALRFRGLFKDIKQEQHQDYQFLTDSVSRLENDKQGIYEALIDLLDITDYYDLLGSHREEYKRLRSLILSYFYEPNFNKSKTL